MMKILIAYDGSTGSDTALTDLRRAGLPEAAEALVLSIADVLLPPDSEGDTTADLLPEAKAARTHALQALRKARDIAQRGSERVKGDFPNWTVHAEAVADSPAWGLIKRADEWGADLIVIGAQGHSALDAVLLGSVPQVVLHEARCAVRIARATSARPDSPVRLIVGLDGSPGAKTALHTVTTRRWPAGSEVRIVAVIDNRLSASIVSANALVEAAATTLTQLGLSVSTLAREGDPKRVLIEEAHDLGADCIFVGASGLTRWGFFGLGTVSSAVATRASCSVEVVRERETKR